MLFKLNGIPVEDPQKLLQTSEMNGYDTSLWEGKANSWVDVRGVDPSYGYFLVSHRIIEEAQIPYSTDETPEVGDDFSTSADIYKLDLEITLEDIDPDTEERVVRSYPDVYVQNWINITPDWDGSRAIYLIKVADARFIFSYPESAWADEDFNIWFNKAEAFLTPEELRIEFELETAPSKGKFVYASYSGKKLGDGSPDLDDMGLVKPFTWEELFQEALKLFTVEYPDNDTPSFPWFESDFEFQLEIDPEISFPEYTPQNITTRYKSGKTFLKQLLFWTNTSLIYDGQGKLRLIPIRSNDLLGTIGEDLAPYQTIIADKKFIDITTGSDVPPLGLSYEFPLLPQERENNEEKEYFSYFIKFKGDGAPLELEKTSAKIPSILGPLVWLEKRKTELEGGLLPDAELLDNLLADFVERFEDLFTQYPGNETTLIGGRNLLLSGHLERLSFYDLGDGPFTQVDPILEFKWDFLLPSPIIPRETKLSIIIGKADGTVTYENDSVVFPFDEAKLITGLFPAEGKGIAYNTFKRNYQDGEEIILVKGVRDDWRQSSQVEGFDGYYTIDPGEYLSLKFLKSKLVPGEDNKVLLKDTININGRSLFSPGDDTIISFNRSPNIITDELEDEWIYIRFDFTVGSNTYQKWTTADAGNFRALLKGVGGYDDDIEEPQVVSHPIFSDGGSEAAKMTWDALSHVLTFIPGWDGSVADQVIGKSTASRAARWINATDLPGGSGGPGGGTGPPGSSQVSICKALVNEPVDVMGAVVDFDNAVVIIGTAPTGGVGFAQNTFNLPFVDNEEILIVQRNDASWTMLKPTINICRGFVNEPTDVARTDAEFDFENPTAIYGKAPTSAAQMVALNPLGHEFADEDELLLIQTTNGKFYPIQMEPQSALFRVTSSIPAATWNNTTSELTIGAGSARKMQLKASSTTIYEVLFNKTYSLKNMAPLAISNSKVVQAKRIGKFWFVDVEPC